MGENSEKAGKLVDDIEAGTSIVQEDSDVSEAKETQVEKPGITSSTEAANVPNADNTAEFRQIATEINKHFDSLARLVRYTKEKDANFLALSKQLEQYRGGMEQAMFKTPAMELIRIREDCRKSIRDGELKEYNAETAGRYIKYLLSDLEDILINLGVEERNGEYYYNGKSLSGDSKIEETAIPEEVSVADEVIMPELTDMSDIPEYLLACENKISAILKDNAATDKLIAVYQKMALEYETGVYQVMLYPVIRNIICLQKRFAERSADELKIMNDENASSLYIADLQYVSEACLDILHMCGVEADMCAEDDFDPKKERVLKVVVTDNPELHGKIMFRYTNCYTMGEKIIYPAKVDIYKSK